MATIDDRAAARNRNPSPQEEDLRRELQSLQAVGSVAPATDIRRLEIDLAWLLHGRRS